MVVSTANYGNMDTHEGTLAEVMGAITGIEPARILSIVYDSGNSKFVAIVRHISRP
jgi:hypothetical protein